VCVCVREREREGERERGKGREGGVERERERERERESRALMEIRYYMRRWCVSLFYVNDIGSTGSRGRILVHGAGGAPTQAQVLLV
jgi:hypothetical protein